MIMKGLPMATEKTILPHRVVAGSLRFFSSVLRRKPLTLEPSESKSSVQIRGRTFNVRQPSLQVIRDLFNGTVPLILELGDIEAALFEVYGVTGGEILAMSDASMADLMLMTEDDLKMIGQAVVSGCPEYFRIRTQFQLIGEAALAQAGGFGK